MARRVRAHFSRRFSVALLLPLAASAALVQPATVAHALTPESATVNIEDVQTSFLFPCTPCPASLGGTSTGDISGVDAGLTPYDVSWPEPGATSAFTGGMQVTAICPPNSPVVTGGTITSGTFTITNAELVYNGAHSGATVTGSFSGNYDGNVLVPVVDGLTISAPGAPTLTITPWHGAGSVEMTPLPPIAGCSGNQTYVLSGSMLTTG